MAVKSDPTTAYSMNYMLGVLINDVLYNKYEGNASKLNLLFLTLSLTYFQ